MAYDARISMRMRFPAAVAACILLLLRGAQGQDLPPGAHYELRTTADPLAIHILTVDPSRLQLALERALDRGVGRESVSSLARRKGAIAGVNAGFFTIGGRYDGEPAGILKIRGEWFSDAALPRGAIGWRKGGREVMMGRVTMRCSLAVGGAQRPVDGLNRARGAAERILYNWLFHRSTLTESPGIEILIAGGRINGVNQGADSLIPGRGYVYSIGAEAGDDRALLRLGRSVKVHHAIEAHGDGGRGRAARWQKMENIVGGAGLLIENGRKVEEHTTERLRAGFVTDRHPRTAVGIRRDGTWVLVVVDGRRPQLSRRMTLAELADLMNALGCRDALNLDGGGSSTMVLQGKVVNSPSDEGGERPISDAILVFEFR